MIQNIILVPVVFLLVWILCEVRNENKKEKIWLSLAGHLRWAFIYLKRLEKLKFAKKMAQKTEKILEEVNFSSITLEELKKTDYDVVSLLARWSSLANR